MRNSTLPSTAMDLYAALGSFIETCYGKGNDGPANTFFKTTACKNCTTISLKAEGKNSVLVDRIVLKEELSSGQFVEEFVVEADGVQVFNGTSIGRSLIALFPKKMNASTITVKVLKSKAAPSFRFISVPNPSQCEIDGPGGHGTSCQLLNGVVIGGFPRKNGSLLVDSVSECCQACRKLSASCVAFTVVPKANKRFCQLLNATGGKTTELSGAVSGYPTRVAIH